MSISKEALLGVCPNCSRETIFMSTDKKNINTCGLCFMKAKQWKNGKIHWAKITEEKDYVDYI